MAKKTSTTKKPTSAKRTVKPLAGPKIAAKRSKPLPRAAAAKPSNGGSGGTPFAPRHRVSHRIFGDGVVLQVDGDKLEIKFKSVGAKWIIDSFVNLA